MRYFLLFIFFCFSITVQAQVLIDTDYCKNKLQQVETTEELPDGLLSGKAIVIHAYPDAPQFYKEQASAIQPGFQKAGIDVVAHYLFEDIFSGREVTQAYQKQLAERDIDFLIYYISGADHQLLIFPFKDKFLDSTAFKLSNSEQKALMHDLYLQTARSKQEQTNFLILQVPGYPDFPKVIQGRRAEFYDLNMKSGKVAIPKTNDSSFNKAIDSVMAVHYPYKYGFVEPGLTEAELRKEGYWFILYGVNSTGKSVKRLLDYSIENEETAYASVVADGKETKVKTIAVNVPVYKFYIKHIQSKDIYVGKQYDADERWEVALRNYILNLRNILD